MTASQIPNRIGLRSSCASHTRSHEFSVNAARMKPYIPVRVFGVPYLTLAASLALPGYANSTSNFVHGYLQDSHVTKESYDGVPSSNHLANLNGRTEAGARSISPSINRTTANTECCSWTLAHSSIPDDHEALAANFNANPHQKCYDEVDDDDTMQERERWGDNAGGRAVSRNYFGKLACVSTTDCRDTHGHDSVCFDPTCTKQALSPSEPGKGCQGVIPGTADAPQESWSVDYAVPIDDGIDTHAGAYASPEPRTSSFGLHRGRGMESTCSVWGGTYEQRRSTFLHRYSQLYNSDIETVEARELHRFEGQVYLDYAGSGVYLESQLRQVYEDLTHNAYSNIHSRSPSSKMSESRLNEARRTVKSLFDAPDDEYTVIFTSGATGALKLIGESFNFTTAVSSFYYLRNNHNSVLGIREYAYTKGVRSVRALAERDVERLLSQREEEAKKGSQDLSSTRLSGTHGNTPSCLFAFPAKDNWNGKFFPLSWVQRVKKNGLSSDGCKWYVLLDAAAHAATTPLSLSKHPADFLVVSFYKIFGYPTGLGALVARNEAACALQRIYWGGGSVAASVCDTRWQKRKGDFSLRFEDGTHSFLAIVGAIYGIHMIQAVGLERIHRHVAALTEHLYERLLQLKHSNGTQGVVVHWKDPAPPSGGIVTFNILHPDGSFVPFKQVETTAGKAGFHLRTGCFCNPGGCQDYLGLTADDIVRSSDNRQSCSDPLPPEPTTDLLSTKNVSPSRGQDYHPPSRRPLGSVRVSLGYLSTFADVDKFALFVKRMWIK